MRTIIVLFVAMVTVFLIMAISPDRISGDFDVYYHASCQFLAKAPIYNPHGGIGEFKYLPLFALVFSPLAMLKELPALYLWSLFNIFLFYFMFYFLYRLKLISFCTLKDFLIMVCLLALTGRAIFNDIKLGQVNILLCFLMLLTMYWEINKKYFLSGCVLAFSLMIKLFPLLFLVYFVLTRRFKIVFYTMLMTAFFLLLPALYTGFALNGKYLQQWSMLLKSSPVQLFYSFRNYSLLSFFSWLFVARHEPYTVIHYYKITQKLPWQVYYAWGAGCLLLFSLFYYDVLLPKVRDLQTKYLDYACLFVCMLLFNPLAYLNAFVLLIIPYFFILRFLFYTDSKERFAVGSLVLLSFIILMGDNRIFFKSMDAFWAFAQWRPLMGTIILAYLSLWLMKFPKKKDA